MCALIILIFTEIGKKTVDLTINHQHFPLLMTLLRHSLDQRLRLENIVLTRENQGYRIENRVSKLEQNRGRQHFDKVHC